MKRLAPDLARNPISMIGAALVTLSAVLFAFVYLLDLFGMHTNPYIGIVFFLIVPAIFIFGLLLIPLGMWRERKARLAGKTKCQTRSCVRSACRPQSTVAIAPSR